MCNHHSCYNIGEYSICLKELDLSWCHGFTNTGLLAFATYLSSDNHGFDYHHYHLASNRDFGDSRGSSSRSNSEHDNQEYNSLSMSNSYMHHNDHHDCPTCLEKLSIEWCSQITDESMIMISSITSLKSICITGCSGITEDGLSCLKRNGIIIC